MDQNVTKADVEKARLNSHQKRQQAEESKNDYSNKLVKFNEHQKTHHHELVPTIINQYQNSFVKNVDEYRMTLNKLVAAEEKFRQGKTTNEMYQRNIFWKSKLK